LRILRLFVRKNVGRKEKALIRREVNLINKYYVYEYVRLDYNEPFYVGKGTGDRWRELKKGRNKQFNNIVSKVPVAVIILHDNLTEDEAYKIECWYIWYYRDIQGYNLVNMTDGGEGGDTFNYLPENKKQKLKKTYSENAKKLWRNENFKNRMSGKNHPMYGVSRKGRDAPNYGKKHTKETKAIMASKKIGKKLSDNHKKNISKSMKGKYIEDKNPMSKKVYMIDSKTNEIVKIFKTKNEFRGDWRKQFPKPNGRAFVEKCLKEKLDFHGYYFTYNI
jgi:hypothetical protein